MEAYGQRQSSREQSVVNSGIHKTQWGCQALEMLVHRLEMVEFVYKCQKIYVETTETSP